MKILHVTAAFHPATAYGGPVVSALALAKAQAALGHEVDVYTTDADGRARIPLSNAHFAGVRVRYFRASPLNSYGVSIGLWMALARGVSRFDVVHCHGTLLPSTSVAMRAAAQSGIATVVSPRGSLMPHARRKKRWRKAVYEHVDAALLRRATLHATSDVEADGLRAAGFRRIAVVPNAVDLEFYGEEAAPTDFPELGIGTHGRIVAWVGRFDPIKNLEVLIEATQGLGATVVLAGEPRGAYADVVRDLIRRSGRTDVRLVGHLQDSAKRALLQRADVYAHPSHMESYGMSIVEALASGCPVVASRGTPWQSLDGLGAGTCVAPTAPAFRAALTEYLSSPADVRVARRVAARAAVEAHSWAARARQMVDVYVRAGEFTEHRGDVATAQ